MLHALVLFCVCQSSFDSVHTQNRRGDNVSSSRLLLGRLATLGLGLKKASLPPSFFIADSGRLQANPGLIEQFIPNILVCRSYSLWAGISGGSTTCRCGG